MKRPKLEDSKMLGNMSLAGASIDYQNHLKELNQYIDFLESRIKLLEECREYDASGKNRPDGYIVPNYYTGKRQSEQCFCERELGTTKDGKCLNGCYYNDK